MIIGENTPIFAGYSKRESNSVYPGRHFWHLVLSDGDMKSVQIKIRTLADVDYLQGIIDELTHVMEKEI